MRLPETNRFQERRFSQILSLTDREAKPTRGKHLEFNLDCHEVL